MVIEYVPIASTIVSGGFTFLLGRQYLDRRRIYQLIWTAAMGLFCTGTLLEFLMNPGIIGPSVALFKTYYLSIGPQVGLLGVGVLFLLTARWARPLLFTVLLLSGISVFMGALTPIDMSPYQASFQNSVLYGIRDAVQAFPFHVRVFTIVLNILGGLLLIGGALFTFALNRTRYYALLIALGGILNAIGGTLLGIFGIPTVFFIFEFLGIVALFSGFLMSYRRTSVPSTLPSAPTTLTTVNMAARVRTITYAAGLSAVYLIYASISGIFLSPLSHGVDVHVVRAFILTLGAARMKRFGVPTVTGFVSAILIAGAPFASPDKAFLVPATFAAGFLYDALLHGGDYAENSVKRNRVMIATLVSGFAESVVVISGFLLVNPIPLADTSQALQSLLGFSPNIAVLLAYLIGRNLVTSVLGASMGRTLSLRIGRK